MKGKRLALLGRDANRGRSRTESGELDEVMGVGVILLIT
jgi:hypothetical protein